MLDLLIDTSVSISMEMSQTLKINKSGYQAINRVTNIPHKGQLSHTKKLLDKDGKNSTH